MQASGEQSGWGGDKYQLHLGSPDNSSPTSTPDAGNLGLNSEHYAASRGLQCARWEQKSLGVEMSTSPESLE